jgi:hypothetical protein
VLAVEVLPEAFGAGRQVDLLTCRLIERADRSGAYPVDGAASTAAFVRQLSGEHDGCVSKRVQVGRALADRMPVTAKAFEAGQLGLDHAQVIQQATRDLDFDLAADLEAFLAEQAAPLTPRQLRVVAEEVLAAAAPDESAAEAARKHAAPHLELSETLDGRWRLDGWLDAEAGLIVSKAIAAFTANRILRVTSSPNRSVPAGLRLWCSWPVMPLRMPRVVTVKVAAGIPSSSACRIRSCSTASGRSVLPMGSACPRRPPGGWRAMPGSSPPSTDPTRRCWTSVVVPAPSPPG